MRWTTVLCMLAAAPVASQTFVPPEGCTGTLTVQQKQCLVTHVWTCEADPAGMQWVALLGENGPIQVKQVDAEFQWLTTYYFAPPRSRVMQTPAPDPESLTELFASSYDTYDFTVVPQEGEVPRRYVGFDRLTGETVIDGEPLGTTAFGFTVYDPEGEVIDGLEGRQYVSERHRLFLLGESWPPGKPEEATDASPVEFVYPGEEGFLALEPRYGCDVVMSSLEALR
ncbi:hypothetical protein [Histidinibacterium aquaticum]|uniref:DUF3108 domain-containing protein n=1 Tax=Histidinibacterium aquaticum TaxID=2613962 RepID=A0A5J5GEN9_9RHOB|nr:hypothetical protein [Histidinibacterium aquaticum]KAA9006689.1 hypothetical protein F3S47_12950 [Histidinibacterium aquaticum]